MEDAKNIKEHYEQAEAFVKMLKDGQAALDRARRELAVARAALETLHPAQHKMICLELPFAMRQAMPTRPSGQQVTHATGAEIIDAEVARINALLGDRT